MYKLDCLEFRTLVSGKHKNRNIFLVHFSTSGDPNDPKKVNFSKTKIKLRNENGFILS